ncbi:RNA polymerase sigma-70 factor [Bacteroides sp. UBA939]|uniref:RNA polymerase sigma-70 factor n=1 Tax=Bacteroides sp. UBA939 TaxID=1946092 RepID=UPI0025B7F702|nr:RNA polymerase sigma-70 factor [Bacteroides sp. UBA939]
MADEITDFELFNSIRRRDRAAFDALFRKYYAPLCRFSFATCLSQEDAEENVQDMFVHLWEKAPVLNIDLSVKAYLYTSTRHYTLNAMQKQQTALHHLNEYSDYAESGEQDEKIPDTEIAELIRSGISTLPEKCREIFILCKQEGLTYEEISAYLNVSEKTIDNQMGIALRKLREYLRPKLNKLLITLLLILFS